MARKNVSREIEAMRAELERRTNGGGPGGWQPREPTPEEADAILQVLIDAGGVELAQTVIDYQLNGGLYNGDDSTD